MNLPRVEFTLEEQFALRRFEAQVENMSEAQAKTFLVQLHELLMTRETMYRALLKKEWGIEPPNLSGMG